MLVLNAGIGTSPYALSVDGIEMMFATNHVGHFLLYQLLLPLMEAGGHTGAARVAVTSRAAINNKGSGFNALNAYGQSKLANVAWDAGDEGADDARNERRDGRSGEKAVAEHAARHAALRLRPLPAAHRSEQAVGTSPH
eukprot:gene21503-12562_t